MNNKYANKILDELNDYIKESNDGIGSLIIRDFKIHKGLLKEEFEVGDWVFVLRDNESIPALVFFQGHGVNTYGFAHNNNSFTDNYESCDTFINPRYNYTKATDKEVEEALIKEAKRRYSKGCKITWDVWGGVEEINLENFKYTNDESESHHNGLWCERRQVFEEESGKWAEIVEQTHLEVIINGETYIKK